MLRKIGLLFYYLFRYPVYKLMLGKIGSSSRLISPTITGHGRIFIGSKVYVNDKAWLACEPLTGDANAALTIGDGTYIGRFSHIYATSKIEIGKKVLMADKVYLSDNLHGYENVELSVIDQPIRQANPVIIKDGAWLGENVCVIGASVGKNSVIGSNSVVTKDIPDYCVAVGSPAVIIKRYNFDAKQWCKTDKEGQFI
ncbi:acyltransferase [Lacibacter sp.]|uniref:acyltransferase n=1 Tax=Lacibacter sp. TaxID=1915409 RepID=UPI002B4B61A4|nr:acyltransferase [Lacibacter sp.]HLP35716.1 acyltransferase [Lacibacter sp.]